MSGSDLQSAPVIDDDRIEWKDGVCRYRSTDADALSDAVIFAVNKCKERHDRETSVLDQTPLYERINPDALDNLFSPRRQSTGEVSFEYEGCGVTVTSDGEIVVNASGGSAER